MMVWEREGGVRGIEGGETVVKVDVSKRQECFNGWFEV